MNITETNLDEALETHGDDGPASPMARLVRRDGRGKLNAALRGLKWAFRGDSSYFAHAYRGLFFVLTAVLLGLGPHQWCLILLAAGLVLVAELGHSAVDAMARALGVAGRAEAEAAREIAAAGVLVAVLVFLVVALVVFVTRMTALWIW